MRWVSPLLIGCALFGCAFAQDAKDKAPAKRYGVDADLKGYPQATPKETLASVLKAVENKRVDYLLAQLADPDWVDRRVKEHTDGFAALVEDGKSRLIDDPGPGKRLTKFLKDGDWKIDDNMAAVRLKEVDDQAVFFRRVGTRWFLENRKK